MSVEIMETLISKNLVKPLRPSEKAMSLKPNSGNCADLIYSSDIQYGSHKLICVALNSSAIRLNSHPDNEEFILLNPAGVEYKPLYLIISLIPHNELQKKIDDEELCELDLLAIKLKFNDPALSFFTMLKYTVHCEVTDLSAGQYPVFFVTEPTLLKQNFINVKDYSVSLLI